MTKSQTQLSDWTTTKILVLSRQRDGGRKEIQGRWNSWDRHVERHLGPHCEGSSPCRYLTRLDQQLCRGMQGDQNLSLDLETLTSAIRDTHINKCLGFPDGSEVKVSACNVGELGSIPGLGRFPGEGNGNPLQYSCLENPMDRGAWWATVHRVTKNRTQLSNFTHCQ